MRKYTQEKAHTHAPGRKNQDFAGGSIFSMGCHSGYIPQPTRPLFSVQDGSNVIDAYASFILKYIFNTFLNIKKFK
jgi:hypothetical protein